MKRYMRVQEQKSNDTEKKQLRNALLYRVDSELNTKNNHKTRSSIVKREDEGSPTGGGQDGMTAQKKVAQHEKIGCAGKDSITRK